MIFFQRVDDLNAKGGTGASGELERSFLGTWIHGKDYYRMDGSTSADTRKKWCNYFNKPANTQVRQHKTYKTSLKFRYNRDLLFLVDFKSTTCTK